MQAAVWKVFYKLLETCQKSEYKFLLNQLAEATEEENQKVKDECDKQLQEIKEQKKNTLDQLKRLQRQFEGMEEEHQASKEQVQRLTDALAKNLKDFEFQVSLRIETEKKLGQLFSKQSI